MCNYIDCRYESILLNWQSESELHSNKRIVHHFDKNSVSGYFFNVMTAVKSKATCGVHPSIQSCSSHNAFIKIRYCAQFRNIMAYCAHYNESYCYAKWFSDDTHRQVTIQRQTIFHMLLVFWTCCWVLATGSFKPCSLKVDYYACTVPIGQKWWNCNLSAPDIPCKCILVSSNITSRATSVY